MKKIFKVIATMLLNLTLCCVSVGCDDVLTLDDGCKTHTWNSGKLVQEATCADFGIVKYTCKKCGEEKTERLSILPHEEAIIAGTAATCTENGLSAGRICLKCEKVLDEQEEIQATGHNPTVYIKGSAATCNNVGYSDAEKCKDCGVILSEQEEIPALGHSFNAEGDCENCGINQDYFEYIRRYAVEGFNNDEEIVEATENEAFKTDTIYVLRQLDSIANGGYKSVPLTFIDVEGYSERWGEWQAYGAMYIDYLPYWGESGILSFTFDYPLMWEDGPSDTVQASFEVPFFVSDDGDVFFVIPSSMFEDDKGFAFTFDDEGTTDYGNTIYLLPVVLQGDEIPIYECDPIW